VQTYCKNFYRPYFDAVLNNVHKMHAQTAENPPTTSYQFVAFASIELRLNLQCFTSNLTTPSTWENGRKLLLSVTNEHDKDGREI